MNIFQGIFRPSDNMSKFRTSTVKNGAYLVGIIHKNENKIESGQHRGAYFQVFRHSLGHIVMPTGGVGGRQNRRPRRQSTRDTSLRDAYALLLHRL